MEFNTFMEVIFTVKLTNVFEYGLVYLIGTLKITSNYLFNAIKSEGYLKINSD